MVTNLIIQKPLHLRIAYAYFDSNICSDHKRWEKLLSCTVSFCIENSSNTESSLSKDTFPFIPSHNEAWKVLVFNTNASVCGTTETKLDNNVSNEELKIGDYNLLQSNRNKNGSRFLATSKRISLIIEN